MSLAELSLQRIAAGIPDFEGEDYRTKLVNGRNAAAQILQQYAPNFSYDQSAALSEIHKIDAWAERNNAALQAAMKQTSDNLPEALKLELGAAETQQFILAGFVNAASGIGPWYSAKIGELVEAGDIHENWAREDAENRLYTFGMIVKLHNDGTLDDIWGSNGSNGTAGFGIPPVVVAILVIGTVAIAATILYYTFSNKRMELNNELMHEICTKAQSTGDHATVSACLDATKDLQQVGGKGITEEVGKVVLILGGLYIAAKYVLPAIQQRRGRSLSPARAWCC